MDAFVIGLAIIGSLFCLEGLTLVTLGLLPVLIAEAKMISVRTQELVEARKAKQKSKKAEIEALEEAAKAASKVVPEIPVVKQQVQKIEPATSSKEFDILSKIDQVKNQ